MKSSKLKPKAIKVLTLHHQAILVDGHCDTFGKILGTNGNFFASAPKPPKHFAHQQKMPTHSGSRPETPRGQAKGHPKIHWQHLDFPRMKKGGIDLQFTAIYIPPIYKLSDATLYALKMLTVIRKTAKDSRNKIILIQSSNDLRNLTKDRRGFLVSIEDGSPLDGNLPLLEMFYHLGVRALGLTHNCRNKLGDGIRVKNPHGLTSFGKQVVRKMEKLGMLIDVAHLAKKGFYDVLKNSSGPIISSHTGVRRLCDIPRNLDDGQIKTIAQRKGVIGIFFIPDFLTGQGNKATVKDVVNHIQYVADKFGVDYVGLGSDFDGYGGITKGLEDATGLPNITNELVNRGFNQTEIKKILGGNFLQVISRLFPSG